MKRRENRPYRVKGSDWAGWILAWLIPSIAVLTPVGSAAQAVQSSAAASALGRAQAGIVTLQGWYDPATGLYRTSGWWNAANSLTVLVDYARLKQTHEYNKVIARTFVAAQKKSPDFINNFYDDEGWWGLAWVDAWDLTHHGAYRKMARSIFENMAGGWDGTCGGGIWWSKKRQYKNAIANELFLSLAAHLASRDPRHRAEYLRWAKREWQWFAASGMINSQHLINDGLTIDPSKQGAAACTNNGRTTWTYNQGVVLGGLADLSQAESNPALLDSAQKIATAAITHLVDGNGVLHDVCEPNCGGDGSQFKGVLLRNLMALEAVAPQPNDSSFIETNANAIWKDDRGPGNQFGVVWSGPFRKANATTQTSALDALIAAAAIETNEN